MDGLAKMICPNCNVGTFRDHPELPTFDKCSLCGYCRKKDLEKRQLLLKRQRMKKEK